ncbi:MAG TPA: DUF3073 domain-containing protein [Flexivirga sp.]|uniref:DUF3073 domain-containing protein n=1 Tax=Flexivirga sp. TaxID=1962927 RepID=UPI002BED4CA5|nr:DUF3073 domain-containing protein [Flexivirga sp.]HWC24443.1 DUF3073 domain-containing protein [Flexivirga sp.]
MGRGRAKAKQTKVARELKYFSPDTDLNALERELSSSTRKTADEAEESSRNDDDYGDYADWASHRD